MLHIIRRLRAFTAIEVLLTIAILGIIAGLSAPAYRNLLIRNDIHLAAEQMRQMIERAKTLAQAGIHGSSWGVYAPQMVLYKGESYGTRDTSFDEAFELPDTVSVAGLYDVSFSPVFGAPTQTGSILFQGINGDEEAVDVVEQLTLAQFEKVIPPPPPPAENVRVRFNFSRVDNWGVGSATATVDVGTLGNRFSDGEWIDLVVNGEMQTDNGGLPVGAPGIGIERGNGFLRVLEYGGFWWFLGKEIVDVTIELEGATVTLATNDGGSYGVENPFNGVVTNSVYEDEVTWEAGANSALYQTRVNASGDAFYLYWEAN